MIYPVLQSELSASGPVEIEKNSNNHERSQLQSHSQLTNKPKDVGYYSSTIETDTMPTVMTSDSDEGGVETPGMSFGSMSPPSAVSEFESICSPNLNVEQVHSNECNTTAQPMGLGLTLDNFGNIRGNEAADDQDDVQLPITPVKAAPASPDYPRTLITSHTPTVESSKSTQQAVNSPFDREAIFINTLFLGLGHDGTTGQSTHARGEREGEERRQVFALSPKHEFPTLVYDSHTVNLAPPPRRLASPTPFPEQERHTLSGDDSTAHPSAKLAGHDPNRLVVTPDLFPWQVRYAIHADDPKTHFFIIQNCYDPNQPRSKDLPAVQNPSPILIGNTADHPPAMPKAHCADQSVSPTISTHSHHPPRVYKGKYSLLTSTTIRNNQGGANMFNDRTPLVIVSLQRSRPSASNALGLNNVPPLPTPPSEWSLPLITSETSAGLLTPSATPTTLLKRKLEDTNLVDPELTKKARQHIDLPDNDVGDVIAIDTWRAWREQLLDLSRRKGGTGRFSNEELETFAGVMRQVQLYYRGISPDKLKASRIAVAMQKLAFLNVKQPRNSDERIVKLVEGADVIHGFWIEKFETKAGKAS